jgi:probable F420-dependent oxidoreductase
MDWGIHLPQLGNQVSRENLKGFAQRLDTLGIHSGWVSDHVCWPAKVEPKYPYTDDGSFPAPNDMAWLDPLGTLLFVSACTENLKLGTTVLILPYRLPVVTAKQLATLDVLSNGRLILGAGIGWMKEEAEVLGMPFDNRGKRSNEQLEIFLSLFTDEEPEFRGDYYQIPKVKFEPKPVQNPIPVWIGGDTPMAFRRVARYGQGFQAAFQPLSRIREEIDEIRQCCENIGRDPVELTFSVRMYLDPMGIMEKEKSLTGTPEQMQVTVAQMASIGVSHILLDPVAPGGIQGRLEAVETFMGIMAG